MRIAAHGFIADGGGSSAGVFPELFRVLLERGHQVDFYGIPVFTNPRSLERYPGYRYVPMAIGWSKALSRVLRKPGSVYGAAIHSVVSLTAYQREAIRLMERAPEPYDFVFCVDTLNLWPSRLPVVSWPQSPPHTEWAAYRTRAIRRSVLQNSGLEHYASVQLFYAYRWLQARLVLPTSDLILSGSPWAYRHWLDFGLSADRVELFPYPIELSGFEGVPPPRAGVDGEVTFLWLGRAVPRKRLDLFLSAFDALRARSPNVKALLVGGLANDPVALRLLERYRDDPDVVVSSGIPRHAVPELFSRVHVLVQPSESENFGFSVAEALAAGRPVVTGPTNGTGAYADDAGFAFESYDPESIARAMERARLAVLANPESLAAVARRAARRHFDPNDVADRLCDVVDRLVKARGKPD